MTIEQKEFINRVRILMEYSLNRTIKENSKINFINEEEGSETGDQNGMFLYDQCSQPQLLLGLSDENLKKFSAETAKKFCLYKAPGGSPALFIEARSEIKLRDSNSIINMINKIKKNNPDLMTSEIENKFKNRFRVGEITSFIPPNGAEYKATYYYDKDRKEWYHYGFCSKFDENTKSCTSDGFYKQPEEYEKIFKQEVTPLAFEGFATSDNFTESYESGTMKVILNGYNLGTYTFRNLNTYNVILNKIELPTEGYNGFNYSPVSLRSSSFDFINDLPYTVKPNEIISIMVLVMDDNISEEVATNLTEQIYNVDNGLYSGVWNFSEDEIGVSSANALTLVTSTETNPNNLVKTNWNLKVDYNKLSKELIESQKLSSQRLSTPIKLPNGEMSKGGLYVPEGFNPFEYDEFVYKLKEIFDYPSSCNSSYKKLPEYIRDSLEGLGESETGFGNISQFLNDPWRFFGGDLEGDCKTKFQELMELYQDEKFPLGTTPELKEQFQGKYDDVNKRIAEFEKSRAGYKEVSSGEPVFGFHYDELSKEDKEIYDKLKKEKLEIEEYYGYDTRNEFDKFMDSELGLVVLLAVAVAVTAAGGYLAGPAYVTAIGLIFDVSIGAYYMSREMYFDGLLWMCFSAFSRLHRLWDKILLKGGEAINRTAAKEAAAEISNYLTQSGLQVRSAQDYMLLRSKLSPEARRLLSTFMRTDPKVILEEITTLGSQNWSNISNAYRQIPRTKLLKMGPALTRGALKMTADLYVISKLHSGFDAVVNFLSSKGINISIGDGAKRHAFLKAMEEQGVSESQMEKFTQNLTTLMSQMNVNSQLLYGDYIVKLIEKGVENANRDFDTYEQNEDIDLNFSPETDEDVKNLKEEIDRVNNDLQETKQFIEETTQSIKNVDWDTPLTDSQIQESRERFRQEYERRKNGGAKKIENTPKEVETENEAKQLTKNGWKCNWDDEKELYICNPPSNESLILIKKLNLLMNEIIIK